MNALLKSAIKQESMNSNMIEGILNNLSDCPQKVIEE